MTTDHSRSSTDAAGPIASGGGGRGTSAVSVATPARLPGLRSFFATSSFFGFGSGLLLA